ncbi:MAG: helix-turn-helix transcriptional regulator [Clostridiales bacterium]|nr:helix-turn-helix transcriptional regulator [Clostridiales bacterium]
MAESDLIRGNVDTLILKVLYDGDRYGYDLIKQINARSGGQWEIKQPTLYACLKRLEKQGFIKSYWDGSESGGGRRKYYTLTESGRAVFIKYRDEYERTRDLFDGLISDDDAMLPVDDFSDVEEDDYSVPKRKRPSKPRKKPEAEEIQPVITEEQFDPSYFDYSRPFTVAADGAPQTETVPNEEEETVSPVETEDQTDDVSESETQGDEYTQQSFFDSLTDTSLTEEEQEDEMSSAVEPEPEEAPTVSEPAYRPAPVVPTTSDPQEIISRLASTYTGNESYSSARSRAPFEPAPEYAERTAAVPAATPPTSPAPVPPPAVPAERTERLPSDSDDGESLASRAYRDILSDLIERSDSSVASSPEQAAAVTADDDRREERRLGSVAQSVAELGNDVQVRDHNDSARVYNRKYYYYSNRLMMTHYLTMCAMMFILGLTLFFTFYMGLNMHLPYDAWMYIITGLLPLIMLIAAIIIYLTDSDKRKRINVNFRASIIIRIVIMLQVFVIIYAVNLMLKMPTSFDIRHIPSLVIPAVYALFIPISEVIFMTLLNSGRYAVE